MTEAERAYAAAEREIERAIENNDKSLELGVEEFNALEELPPKISRLFGLEELGLYQTKVIDLSPLTNLTAIKYLYLSGSHATDLSPLENMTMMEELCIDYSQVVDLKPLQNLPAILDLDLSGTQITDLSPLIDLPLLRNLHLDDTQVADLRPILEMPLHDHIPLLARLTFTNCRATQLDPEIHRISKIEDSSERARTLFAYLEDWQPPKTTQDALNEPPSPPAKKPSPLQPAIKNNRLVRNGQSKLPDSDALTRAEYGWQALKDYRDAFETAFNYGNYAPLPNMLTHFDRAMGDTFDPTRTISIGSAGERLIQLSQNEAFLSCLPAGIDTDFKAFAAQIALYVERFPDWKEYRSDTEEASTTPKTIAEEKLSFDAIALSLEESPDTDSEVSTEFRHELDAATGTYADEHTARGLLASASEVVRVQSEHVFGAMKDGALVRKEIEAMDGVADGEWAKIKFWAGGFTLIFLKRNEIPLRRLAERFPKQMGWTSRVLDYLFGPKPT